MARKKKFLSDHCVFLYIYICTYKCTNIVRYLYNLVIMVKKELKARSDYTEFLCSAWLCVSLSLCH